MVDRYELANLAMRVVNAEPHRRTALIDEATAGRPELRDAVTRLIECASSGLDDDPLAELGRIFKLAVRDEHRMEGTDDADEVGGGDPFDQSGTSIDRYRLIRRLGAGASGAVYLAEQESPVKRRVALKLVHHGAGTPRLRQRFRLEQRVLASLDHPGIARLIDAGEAPDGRPYIVMELIDGPGVIAHCREEALPLRRRVQLLATVCDAVQHAHGRGVIHRDLKPGNIVMRRRDGAAEPVVVDFGVARLLDPDPEFALTSLGQSIGTRRYMSPEQRAGETVDARSDIWSLGVTIAEVVEVMPEKAGSADAEPEDAAVSMPSPGTSIASPSGAAKTRSMVALPRELRWIVERCCAVDPNERYQAAAELGADLRRFLASEPVSAAPPSLFYRTGRLLARHPVRTAAAALVLLAIVGAAGYAELARARLAREVAAQRDLIIATIDDVLDEVWVFIGSEAAREKLIARLLERTDELLRLVPEDTELLQVRARLLRALDYLATDRGRSGEAMRASREALAIYERLAPERRADVEFIRAHAEAIVRVGVAVASNHPGIESAAGAKAHFERALEMQREALARHPAHVGLRDDLCWSALRMLSYVKGEERVRRIQECIATAESLLADTPDRDLSKFIVCSAHMHAGMHFMRIEPPSAAAARRHMTEALRLSRELVRSQPQRGGFVKEHLAILASLVNLNLLAPRASIESGGTRQHEAGNAGAEEVLEELERHLRALDTVQWNRGDLQEVASGALGLLARAHARAGRDAQARDTVRWVQTIANDPAISWTPRGRAMLEETRGGLRDAGLSSSDDSPQPVH